MLGSSRCFATCRWMSFSRLRIEGLPSSLVNLVASATTTRWVVMGPGWGEGSATGLGERRGKFGCCPPPRTPFCGFWWRVFDPWAMEDETRGLHSFQTSGAKSSMSSSPGNAEGVTQKACPRDSCRGFRAARCSLVEKHRIVLDGEQLQFGPGELAFPEVREVSHLPVTFPQRTPTENPHRTSYKG